MIFETGLFSKAATEKYNDTFYSFNFVNIYDSFRSIACYALAT